jgi:hypothetical protein
MMATRRTIGRRDEAEESPCPPLSLIDYTSHLSLDGECNRSGRLYVHVEKEGKEREREIISLRV